MGEATSRTDRVVERLFRAATQSVLLTSYNLDRPQNSQKLFAPLARRMEKHPAMQVRLCLHIKWEKEWEQEKDPLEAGLSAVLIDSVRFAHHTNPPPPEPQLLESAAQQSRNADTSLTFYLTGV